MRPVVITLTGNGASISNSSPVPMDWRLDPVAIGYVFTTSGNTTAFKVQYSLDDPQKAWATSYNTNATWIDHASLTNLTGTAAGSTTTPVRGVRLQASASGTDTGTLTIVQAGN